MNHVPKKGVPFLYKGIAAGVVLVAVLVLSFHRDPAGPEGPPAPSTPFSPEPRAAPAMAQGHYRLAVMESFAALDTRVAHECVPPLKLNSQWFESEEHHQLASRFIADVLTYETAEPLVAFMEAVEQVLAQPGDNIPNGLLEKFRAFAGSGPLLDSNRHPDVLSAIHQIANRRLQHLIMREQSGYLENLMDQGLVERIQSAGVEMTSVRGAPAELPAILRYWELTSTRYLLCQSGNNRASLVVRNLFPGKYHPVYANALNAVLDPVRRRFQVLSTLAVDASQTGSVGPVGPGGLRGPVLQQAPNGPVALVAFKGALPRAKLYADWRHAGDDKNAKKIIFSQSFNPQLQVVLRPATLPAPQRPAETDRLPSVKIRALDARAATLEIPPVEHNTVLLLTNLHDAGWQATIDKKSAAVIRANLNACAIYLEPSKSKRVVEYTLP